MLALNAKGDLLADRILAHGTATGCLISPREFFREALRYGATSALAWHNHPSGDPRPIAKIFSSPTVSAPLVRALACPSRITWSWVATAGTASGRRKDGTHTEGCMLAMWDSGGISPPSCRR